MKYRTTSLLREKQIRFIKRVIENTENVIHGELIIGTGDEKDNYCYRRLHD